MQKGRKEARDFVKNLSVSRSTLTCILHTRLATQGSEYVNENNHPIRTGNLVGVHNGMVWNDDELFAALQKEDPNIPRHGQVDSEAIFAYLGNAPKMGSKPIYALEEIEGSAAIAWLDETDSDPTTLHLARISSSPLVLGYLAEGGVVFASTAKAIEDAAEACDLTFTGPLVTVEEGTYMRFGSGAHLDTEPFNPPTYVYKGWSGNYKQSGNWYIDSAAATPPADDENEDAERLAAAYRGRVNMADMMGWDNTRSAEYVPSVTRTMSPSMADVQDLEGTSLRYLAVGRLPVHDLPAYYTEHEQREARIDSWVSFNSDDNPEVLHDARRMGAFLRPGDAVSVYMNGSVVAGRIVTCPPSFPDGAYTVRVTLNNDTRFQGYEPALVLRYWWEMRPENTPNDQTARLRALPAVAGS